MKFKVFRLKCSTSKCLARLHEYEYKIARNERVKFCHNVSNFFFFYQNVERKATKVTLFI